MRNPFDPFGIAASCWAVQKAWLEHPQALTQEMSKLARGWVALQVWQRFNWDRGDLIPAVKYDERFQDPQWTKNPYLDAIKEYYLLYSHWLEDAIYATPNTPEKTKRKAAFWARQGLDAAAPSNWFWSNPVALSRFVETGGGSLVQGWSNFLDDARRNEISIVDPSGFEVGKNLATTPGAVVFRNELVELIQYSPTTEQVHAVPVVIIAPWINKYYILDLNEKRSLVRHLVDQGFTVFVTSWKNIGADLRTATLDDYLVNGVLEAIQTAKDICQASQVHLAGYCIGGTLAAAALAWLNRQDTPKSDIPVAHGTLLTTLLDFSSPGDIEVFIDEESLQALEERMARHGYLDGKDMAVSFRLLRPNSLIWHYFVHNYLYGELPPRFDVLYWNMDTTRMPEAMHSFYLRELYLNNKLVQKNGVTLAERPIDLARIDQPLYIVGTEQDHIAPWKETFKACRLAHGSTRFVLATSGHIMGILSPPVDPPKRRYWASEASGQDDPNGWRSKIEKVPGSWWTDWIDWLRPQCGALRDPPRLGGKYHPPLADAPGTYVFE